MPVQRSIRSNHGALGLVSSMYESFPDGQGITSQRSMLHGISPHHLMVLIQSCLIVVNLFEGSFSDLATLLIPAIGRIRPDAHPR